MKLHSILCLSLFLFGSCTERKTGDTTPSNAIKQQLEELSEIRTEAEKNDDLESLLVYYDENTISMPEYQPTLHGIDEIEVFYQEIFQRQNIKTFQRTADEIICLDNTIVEIGTFKKEYTDLKLDTVLLQNGKYWNIWKIQSDGSFKLKGETFGFFHPVEHPEALVVALTETQPDKTDVYSNQKIPLELRAYNALNEKYVRMRDGALRSEFYTSDPKFMPFQEPTVTGIDEIKPYLIEYSSRGEVTIDSIAVYTYRYENFDDYILEYAKFKVKWIAPQRSGSAEGKGIRLWKRQNDGSLKIYRETGTHNYEAENKQKNKETDVVLIKELSAQLTRYAQDEDVTSLLSLYDSDVSYLPQYKFGIFKKNDLQHFYANWLSSTKITNFKREIANIDFFSNRAIEIGNFIMVYQNLKKEESEYHGKYMVVWKEDKEGYKIEAECYGSSEYIPIERVPYYTVNVPETVSPQRSSDQDAVDHEILALNSEVITHVEAGNGEGRAEGYHHEGIYMPNFSKMLMGIDSIRPFLMRTYTPDSNFFVDHSFYDIEEIDKDHVMVVGHFKGGWNRPNDQGLFGGNMLNIRKRNDTGKLVMYRQIVVSDR